ncbi:MAG: hypothetical protein QXE44_07525, partial [Nitrososphaerota archaeon]
MKKSVIIVSLLLLVGTLSLISANESASSEEVRVRFNNNPEEINEVEQSLNESVSGFDLFKA